MADPAMANIAGFGVYTPAEAIELVSRAGVKKGNMRPDKIFISAISAGCLLSFAAAASLRATTAPWFQENAPGLVSMVAGLIFPLGLLMIVLTGADLFTGSNMYTAVAAFHGRLSFRKMLLHWFICFWGNLAGALFVMAIIIGYGGVFDSSSYKARAIEFVTSKQVKPAFHQIFIRAIGCNWLVCLACYLGMQGKDVNSKIVAMWWPIFTFVSLGLDHVVANMFYVPLGLWLGTPDLTVALYIWKGIVPASLGNIIGGALFCGVYYYWMFIFREPEIKIDGVYYQEKMEEGSLPTQSNLSSQGSSSRRHLKDVTVDNSRRSSHDLKREFHGLP
ncbi:formate transporter [Podospora conica]|nr:formate transporter [Schizothecium conicum]